MTRARNKYRITSSGYAECEIDLLCFAILSNHFHLVLRSRPDVVATWDDSEVARRWLLLCPVRKHDDGTPKEPSEAELNAIRNDLVRLAEIRRRLSDISWWMRLVCQRIATRANHEDGEVGKFWQSRFRAVRLLDEESLLACAAYVDLNPIRAALAETLGESDFTSVQRRIQSLQDGVDADQFLAPLFIDETTDSPGPHPSLDSHRCSDKGFLPLPLADYLQLLDWTARQTAAGKLGSMCSVPAEVSPILERLSLDACTWCELVRNFGRVFIMLQVCRRRLMTDVAVSCSADSTNATKLGNSWPRPDSAGWNTAAFSSRSGISPLPAVHRRVPCLRVFLTGS